MNIEYIEKFVNVIVCDLEEGGFWQVSGIMLCWSLIEVVSVVLLLLEMGNFVFVLVEQQGDVWVMFEVWMIDVVKIVVGSCDLYLVGLECDYWCVW